MIQLQILIHLYHYENLHTRYSYRSHRWPHCRRNGILRSLPRSSQLLIIMTYSEAVFRVVIASLEGGQQKANKEHLMEEAIDIVDAMLLTGVKLEEIKKV